MTPDVYTNPIAVILTIDFLRLVLGVISVLLALRVVLYVEKRLDLYFKLLALGFIIITTRHFLRILVNLEILEFGSWMNWFDLAPSVLTIIALLVMNNLVNTMRREK